MEEEAEGGVKRRVTGSDRVTVLSRRQLEAQTGPAAAPQALSPYHPLTIFLDSDVRIGGVAAAAWAGRSLGHPTSVNVPACCSNLDVKCLIHGRGLSSYLGLQGQGTKLENNFSDY